MLGRHGYEYVSYQWLHIRALLKYLGWQDWGFWCFLLTLYSCCSRCTTEFPRACVQSGNIRYIATWLAWLKYLGVTINNFAVHHISMTLLETLKASKLTYKESSGHQHLLTQICSRIPKILSIFCIIFFFFYHCSMLDI